MIKKLLISVLLSISSFGIETGMNSTDLEKKSMLTRDNSKEIITDSTTDLMWQDDNRARSVQKDWSEAKEYCQSLTQGNYSDWHLPTISELESIINFNKSKPAIKSGFKNVAFHNYWSSSPNVSSSNNTWIWSVYFRNGDSNGLYKMEKLYIRCVRKVQNSEKKEK